jgi:hypothetical protein
LTCRRPAVTFRRRNINLVDIREFASKEKSMNRASSPSSPTTPARRPIIALAAGIALCAGMAVTIPAGAATPDPTRAQEGLPPGMPEAALAAEPSLPTADGWTFSEDYSRISGTSRLDTGALLWTDWLYDDTGAGAYTYTAPEAAANGADVFRAAVAVDAEHSYWRVDWNTLVDPTVPVAAWTFDTDADTATGVET